MTQFESQLANTGLTLPSINGMSDPILLLDFIFVLGYICLFTYIELKYGYFDTTSSGFTIKL